MLNDIAIGINLGSLAPAGGALHTIANTRASSRSAAQEDAAARDACLRGQLLACARATWMMTPGAAALSVLLLVDCAPICKMLANNMSSGMASSEVRGDHARLPHVCRGALEVEGPPMESLQTLFRSAARKVTRPKSTSFTEFGRAAWLTQRPHLPLLHFRCYWGYLSRPPLFTNMHRKTLVLFRALADVMGHRREFGECATRPSGETVMGVLWSCKPCSKRS